jgi:hypothetical protein
MDKWSRRVRTGLIWFRIGNQWQAVFKHRMELAGYIKCG